jgi:hypothetical protein
MEGRALAQAWPLVRRRVLACARRLRMYSRWYAPLSKLLDCFWQFSRSNSGALDSGLLDSVLTVLASAGKGDA